VKRILPTVALALLLAALSRGQSIKVAGGDMTLEPAARTQAIDGILKAIRESYVYPEIAEKMAQAILERRVRGEYDSITSGRQLAQLLTEHLRLISKDKHLAIGLIGNRPPGLRMPWDTPTPADLERERASLSKSNFGFPRVERLAGNVGLLEIRAFHPADFIGDTVAAAMNFLANTDALIVDLRENGGGHSSAIALVLSYLFAPDPVHLDDVYWRPSDSTHQWWTLPYVPGRRLATQEVYILTSGKTFSAAEEFAYDLKALKRATIVGEQTAGGAHPIRTDLIVMDHFGLMLPAGRVINPVTKTDWEGVGVEPDIRVPASIAFQTAYLKALEKAAERLASSREIMTVGPIPTGNPRTEIDDAIRKLRAELSNSGK
jgi:hypothetical protein